MLPVKDPLKSVLEAVSFIIAFYCLRSVSQLWYFPGGSYNMLCVPYPRHLRDAIVVQLGYYNITGKRITYTKK